MTNDQIAGIGHQVKGAIKSAFGKLIGDAKTVSDGEAESTSGKAQVAAASICGQVMGIDVDRIQGVAHQLEGALKEGVGNLMSDPSLRQAGAAEREAGKVQNAVGGARDSARDVAEEAK